MLNQSYILTSRLLISKKYNVKCTYRNMINHTICCDLAGSNEMEKCLFSFFFFFFFNSYTTNLIACRALVTQVCMYIHRSNVCQPSNDFFRHTLLFLLREAWKNKNVMWTCRVLCGKSLVPFTQESLKHTKKGKHCLVDAQQVLSRICLLNMLINVRWD